MNATHSGTAARRHKLTSWALVGLALTLVMSLIVQTPRTAEALVPAVLPASVAGTASVVGASGVAVAPIVAVGAGVLACYLWCDDALEWIKDSVTGDPVPPDPTKTYATEVQCQLTTGQTFTVQGTPAAAPGLPPTPPTCHSRTATIPGQTYQFEQLAQMTPQTPCTGANLVTVAGAMGGTALAGTHVTCYVPDVATGATVTFRVGGSPETDAFYRDPERAQTYYCINSTVCTGLDNAINGKTYATNQAPQGGRVQIDLHSQFQCCRSSLDWFRVDKVEQVEDARRTGITVQEVNTATGARTPVQTVTSPNLSAYPACTSLTSGCVVAKDSTGTCKWGPYTMPASDCTATAEPVEPDPWDPGTQPSTDGTTTTYNPDGSVTVVQTQTQPDGSKRVVTTTTLADGSKTITTRVYPPGGGSPTTTVVRVPSPTAPTGPPTSGPNPTDPDAGSCIAGAWSWNPVDWVFVPVKCALSWAFGIKPATLARLQAVRDLAASKPPMSLAGGAPGLVGLGSVGSSCPSWRVTVAGYSEDVICGQGYTERLHDWRNLTGAVLVALAVSPFLRSVWYAGLPVLRITPHR